MGKHLIRLVNAVEQGPSLSYSRLPGQMKGTSGVQRTLDISVVYWITSPRFTNLSYTSWVLLIKWWPYLPL